MKIKYLFAGIFLFVLNACYYPPEKLGSDSVTGLYVTSNKYKEINVTTYEVEYDGEEFIKYDKNVTTLSLINEESALYIGNFSGSEGTVGFRSFMATFQLDANRTYTVAGWLQEDYNLTGIDLYGIAYSKDDGLTYTGLNTGQPYHYLYLNFDINATGDITVSIASPSSP